MPGLTTAQRALLDEWQDLTINQFNRYADGWTSGQMDLATFEGLFKQELKDLYVAMAWTATGSVVATTFSHYGLIGRRLRDQYGYMHGMFERVAGGEMTADQLKANMAMYARSSRQILEQVGIDADDMPTLPAYPADGSTTCGANDRCEIESVRAENGWDIYWRLSDAEHCDDCTRRAGASPLRVRFGRVVNAEVWS